MIELRRIYNNKKKAGWCLIDTTTLFYINKTTAGSNKEIEHCYK